VKIRENPRNLSEISANPSEVGNSAAVMRLASKARRGLKSYNKLLARARQCRAAKVSRSRRAGETQAVKAGNAEALEGEEAECS
jgi:hypothetical protein